MNSSGGVPLPIVGAGKNTCRWRYTFLGFIAVLLLAFPAGGVCAQARVVEEHQFSDPEGRLLAFYSAAMSFTPAGIAPDAARFSLALEVSYVPYLNDAQRRPSIDKPESTNLAPFFPRPRASVRLGSWSFEGSWIPPMKVFDVEANLLSAAIIAPGIRAGAVHIDPRIWGTIGSVKGSMTCSASEMVGHGTDLELYYNTICHGRESDDWFEPRTIGGEVVVSEDVGTSLRPYAMFGARYDKTRFDIGVLNVDGSRDSDHPILQLDSFRPHAAVGLAWRASRNVAGGGELFYAPGSVLTMRISGRWIVRQ